ncbi:MAG: hypothetical protein WCP34_16155 [Pseudomonadota bacterium]
MSLLTLEIPDELDTALREVSVRRRVHQSVLVREVLEKALVPESQLPNNAERWVSRWRGSLRDTTEADSNNETRLADVLKKHMR